MATLYLLCAVLILSTVMCPVSSLRIAWLIPGGASSHKINTDTSIAAVKLAMKSLSRTAINAGNNSLSIKLFETDCDTKSAMTAMLQVGSYDPDVIFGPPCHEAMKIVGRLASFANLPVFGWYNPSTEFDDVTMYPTLIRMMPSVRILAKTLIHIMSQYGWRRLALIYETNELGTHIKEWVVDEVSKATDLRILRKLRMNNHMTDGYLQRLLNSIKTHATVIVLACSGSVARRILVTADKVGMTNGQYTFIHLDYQVYTDAQLRRNVLSDTPWKRGDPSDEAAGRAFQSLIHIVMDPMYDENSIASRVLPRSKYEEFSKLAVAERNSVNPKWHLPAPVPLSDWTPDVYSMFLYDSVLVWSVLTEVLNKSGYGYRNGRLMARLVKGFNSKGTTGYITFNNNAERLGNVFVLDMTRSGKFKPVQILRFNKSGNADVTNLNLDDNMFVWRSHRSGIAYQPTNIPTTRSTSQRQQTITPPAELLKAQTIDTNTIVSTQKFTTTTNPPKTTLEVSTTKKHYATQLPLPSIHTSVMPSSTSTNVATITPVAIPTTFSVFATEKPTTTTVPPSETTTHLKLNGQPERKRGSVQENIIYLAPDIASLVEFQSILKALITKRQPIHATTSATSTPKHTEANDSLPLISEQNAVTDTHSSFGQTPGVRGNIANAYGSPPQITAVALTPYQQGKYISQAPVVDALLLQGDDVSNIISSSTKTTNLTKKYLQENTNHYSQNQQKGILNESKQIDVTTIRTEKKPSRNLTSYNNKPIGAENLQTQLLRLTNGKQMTDTRDKAERYILFDPFQENIKFPSQLPVAKLWNFDKRATDTDSSKTRSLFPSDVLTKADLPVLSEFLPVKEHTFMTNYGIRSNANDIDSSAIQKPIEKSYFLTEYKEIIENAQRNTSDGKKTLSSKKEPLTIFNLFGTSDTTTTPASTTTHPALRTTHLIKTTKALTTRKPTLRRAMESKPSNVSNILERLMKLEALIRASVQKTSPAPSTLYSDSESKRTADAGVMGISLPLTQSQLLAGKPEYIKQGHTGVVWGSTIRADTKSKSGYAAGDDGHTLKLSNKFRKSSGMPIILNQKTITTVPYESFKSTTTAQAINYKMPQEGTGNNLNRYSRTKKGILMRQNRIKFTKPTSESTNNLNKIKYRHKTINLDLSEIGSTRDSNYKVRDNQQIIHEPPKIPDMIIPRHIIPRAPVQYQGVKSTLLAKGDINNSKSNVYNSMTNPIIEKISANVVDRVTNEIMKHNLFASINNQNETKHAVHIVSDWIPSHIEEEPPRLKMTFQINKTQSSYQRSHANYLNKTVSLDLRNISRSSDKIKPGIVPEYKLSLNDTSTASVNGSFNNSKTKQEEDDPKPVKSEPKGDGLKISLAPLMSSWGFKPPSSHNMPPSGMQSSRAMAVVMSAMRGMPQTGMPQMPPGMPQMPPGMPQTGMPQMPPGMPQMPPGMPQMPPGMPQMPPGMPQMPPGMPQMPPGMPQMPRGMPQMPPMSRMPPQGGMPPMPPMPFPGAMHMMRPRYGKQQSSEEEEEEPRNSGRPSYGHHGMFRNPHMMYQPQVVQRKPVYHPPPMYRPPPPSPWYKQSSAGHPPYPMPYMQRGPPMWHGR